MLNQPCSKAHESMEGTQEGSLHFAKSQRWTKTGTDLQRNSNNMQKQFADHSFQRLKSSAIAAHNHDLTQCDKELSSELRTAHHKQSRMREQSEEEGEEEEAQTGPKALT